MDNSEKTPDKPQQTESQKATEDILSKSKKLKQDHDDLKGRMEQSAKDINNFLHKKDNQR